MEHATRPTFASLVGSLAVGGVILAGGAGCGQSVMVDHWEAPTHDVHGLRRVAVTDAYGRDGSVLTVGAFAVDALLEQPWYTEVVDLLDVDRLETYGHEASLARGHLAGDTLYIRFDVYEDSATVSTRETIAQNDDGSEDVFIEETVTAHTLIALTAADAFGVVVDEVELEGIHELVGPATDAAIRAAMDEAAWAAVTAAVAEITPRLQRVSIPLDERDEDILSLLIPAISGDRSDRLQVAAALADDDSAPAIYNRAVMLEAAGDLEDAVDLYAAAARHPGAVSFAIAQRDAARQRLEDARRVGLVGY